MRPSHQPSTLPPLPTSLPTSSGVFRGVLFLDPNPDPAEKKNLDPDPVYYYKLDPDPVDIRSDPQAWMEGGKKYCAEVASHLIILNDFLRNCPARRGAKHPLHPHPTPIYQTCSARCSVCLRDQLCIYRRHHYIPYLRSCKYIF